MFEWSNAGLSQQSFAEMSEKLFIAYAWYESEPVKLSCPIQMESMNLIKELETKRVEFAPQYRND